MGNLDLHEYVNMKGKRLLGWMEGGGQQGAGTTDNNSWGCESRARSCDPHSVIVRRLVLYTPERIQYKSQARWGRKIKSSRLAWST